MLRLDLGCGPIGRPGFIGMDRFPMPGVSVVSTFDDHPLPFKDNSFDLIIAVHSLEHAADQMNVLRELWRVGKPGAQLVINAPYYMMRGNLSNPYHKQAFTEHTPRFWTHVARTHIDPVEYVHPPQGEMFGLSRSDHSDPGFDLRPIRMELFYFAEYWHLSPERLRRERRRHIDVVDQILYHLLIFKPPLTEPAVESVEMDFWMPPHLDARREQAAATRSAHLALEQRKRNARASLERLTARFGSRRLR